MNNEERINRVKGQLANQKKRTYKVNKKRFATALVLTTIAFGGAFLQVKDTKFGRNIGHAIGNTLNATIGKDIDRAFDITEAQIPSFVKGELQTQANMMKNDYEVLVEMAKTYNKNFVIESTKTKYERFNGNYGDTFLETLPDKEKIMVSDAVHNLNIEIIEKQLEVLRHASVSLNPNLEGDIMRLENELNILKGNTTEENLGKGK